LQNGNVVPHPPPDLKSNAPDMLTFLKASLGELPGVPNQLAQAIALTQAVHWKSPKLDMGLAWQRPHPKAGAPQVIWKNGAASGFTSFMGMVPSQKLAVVLLTNSDAATPTRAGLQILAALENSGS
jgi:beta-lactamase class C